MTRARTLKTTIRARMSQTGERYTVARRHVLAARQTPPAPAPAATSRPTRSAADVAATAAVAVDARGGASDAKVRERTGHDLTYWFDVLDTFGGARHGHTAAARHLREQHGVDGWYSQAITVAYGRARGLRATNQRVDGKFGASVSLTVPRPASDVAGWITSPHRRPRWAPALGPDLARVLTDAVKGTAPKGLWRHESGQYRCRHRWADGVFQLMLMPKPDDRTTVLVEHSLVATRANVEQYRASWRAGLKALAEALRAPRP